MLVSASGAEFRQNSFTDDNGVLTYTGLVSLVTSFEVVIIVCLDPPSLQDNIL